METVLFRPNILHMEMYTPTRKNSDSDGNAGLDITTVHLGDCNSMIIYQHLYSTKCNFFLDRNL
jgi:hypothetical protein